MAFRKIYAGIVRDCFLGINTPQHDCARPQTCSYQKFLFYYTIQPLSGFFHGAFHRLLLFTKKYFPHQTFRTCRLRHKTHTTKTKLNKSLLVRRKKVSVAVRQNDSGLRHSQNDVRNTKTFSQQTMHAQSKRSTAWIRPHSFLHKI